MADHIIWQLRIGSKLSGFTVEPDGQWRGMWPGMWPGMWRGMWRVHCPDGYVTDMYNLSWARQHCVSLTRPRGLGGGEKIFWDRREIALGTCSVSDELAGPP